MIEQETVTSNSTEHLILAVDDDRIQRMLLEKQLSKLGYNVLTASDGKEAVDVIHKNANDISAVLLDREMPEMSGMEVVDVMKKHPQWRKIPIIMQTGSDKDEHIREGIDAGVFYYLTKPLKEDLLKAAVSSAVRESDQTHILNNELKKHRSSFALINKATFTLHTLEEAEHLSCFLAYCYPEPERVLQGIAILLINAVEHGNLNIGYNLKTELLQKNIWREEVEKMQKLPENTKKKVTIVLRRTEKEIALQISDEGKGFDWRNYMEIDPARATDNHGRGIAMANASCFNKLVYNDTGNQVTASIAREDELEW